MHRRWLFIVLSVVMVFSIVLWQLRTRSDIETNSLPKDGLNENDTNGTVPGMPENGRRCLRNFHKLWLIFVKAKGFAPDQKTFFTDILQNSSIYGIKSIKDIKELFENEDAQYSDDPGERTLRKAISIHVVNKRPDGTNITLTDPNEVIAYSELYVHSNRRQFPGERTTLNPVGFYQVLRASGAIDEVPYDQVVYAFVGKNAKEAASYTLAFASQPGLPTTTLTYDEYWTEVLKWPTPPHGKKDGKGSAWQGDSYR